jgi:4-hydroxymandelate oxidase
VFVALALGADAVLLGRPMLQALRTGGEPALTEHLSGLRANLTGLLTEAGRSTRSELDTDAVLNVRSGSSYASS